MRVALNSRRREGGLHTQGVEVKGGGPRHLEVRHPPSSGIPRKQDWVARGEHDRARPLESLEIWGRVCAE